MNKYKNFQYCSDNGGMVVEIYSTSQVEEISNFLSSISFTKVNIYLLNRLFCHKLDE